MEISVYLNDEDGRIGFDMDLATLEKMIDAIKDMSYDMLGKSNALAMVYAKLEELDEKIKADRAKA